MNTPARLVDPSAFGLRDLLRLSARLGLDVAVEALRTPRARVASLLRLLAELPLAAAPLLYLGLLRLASLDRRGSAAIAGWIRATLHGPRRVRRTLATVAVFAVAVSLGISAGGSTFALWNKAVPVGAASLSTGTTGITVNGATTYAVPDLTTTQLLPGLSAVSPQVLTILNTGSTPLSISVGSPVFSDTSNLLAQNNNLNVVLFQSSTCAQSVDGSSTAAWTSAVVVAPGSSITACLQMTLSATAPATVQGLASTFTLPINGTQVRNQ